MMLAAALAAATKACGADNFSNLERRRRQSFPSPL